MAAVTQDIVTELADLALLILHAVILEVQPIQMAEAKPIALITTKSFTQSIQS